MTYRSLAIACFSHLGRRAETMPLMQKALSMTDSEEVLYETVILMDQQNAAPEDKIALLAPRAASMHRDDLFVELAKAYNQARQPEKARETLLGHVFTACEGGEHAIADQYMYSFFQQGMQAEAAGDFETALSVFRQALTLPATLGAGIWN